MISPATFRRACSVLSGAVLVVLLVTSPVGADPMMRSVEHDGLTGRLESLEATRALLAERAQAGSEAAASLRYDRAFVAWWIARALDDRHSEDKRRDARLDDAAEYLDALLEDDPDDIESMVLLSAILSDQAGRSMFKRLTLGRRAFNLAARAIELAPDNPRACLQRGKILLYAPAMVGGGAAKAVELLERARAALARADDGWPSWGRIDILGWYSRALAHDGRLDEARAIYREALEIEPDARWIRDELIPEIDPDGA